MSYLPLLMVVCSSTIYHICAKSVSPKLNTFASLTVAYLIWAVLTVIIYYATSPTKSLVQEFSHLNWATVVMGLAIVGLEAGNILMYKAGWNISVGSLINNITVSIILLFVGLLLYKEKITPTQIAGIVLCLAGLVLVNRK